MPLSAADDGFGVTPVVVVRGFTVSADVPELVLWVLSPEKVAVIVTGAVDDGVYIIVQALALELVGASVQEEPELKLPPAPPSLHDTVPVGLVFVPMLGSLTAAL